MKLDTSKPKDWRAFVNSLGVAGLDRLFLHHCDIEVWEFPEIILTVEIDEPAITLQRIESLRLILANHYECDKVNLRILPKIPGTRFYTSEGYLKHIQENNLKEIEKRIELQKHSEGMYVAICPFHEEKTPSFSVHVLKNMYHCFGCGEHGELEEFAKKFDDLQMLKQRESKENRLRFLQFARLRCKQVMIHIDYQFANNYERPECDVRMDEIQKKVKELNDDIKRAEEC